jgi:type I restriction enzyme S subunit
MDVQAEGLTPAQVLGVGNVLNDGNLDVESVPVRYLAQSELECIAHEGDLLVVKSSGSATNIRSGKTAICPHELTGRIACSNFMMLLRPAKDKVEPRWLWRYLNGRDAKAFVQLIAGSSTYPNIKWSSYKNLLVPVPPFHNQQHIVAKLDEQMAALDRAEKALAEQQAAASDFLQAALEAVFDLAAHPAWPQVRLGAVSDVIDRKVDPQQHVSQMYAHYSIPAFDTGEGPIFELGSEIRSAKCEVADGCVLFSKLNPRIPRVWHVHDHVDVPRICSTEFLVLQPKLEHVIATYLTWILQSPPFLRTIRSRVQAATKSRERVPENVVVSTPILVPSLGEQQHIVAKLDEQMMSLGLVQSALAHQTADLGGLRNTLLNAVFSGEV